MKRLMWTVVAGLVLGAAALWGAGRLVWSQDSQELVWPTPLALLVLASVGAMLALRAVGRRLLGGVLITVGVAACVLGVVDAELFGIGPLIALLGGLLIAGSGGVLVARGHQLPRLGSRYEAPAAQREEQRKTTDDGDREADDLWTALSEGKDPTDDG